MADPVATLTAGAIATLALQKFIESGIGELSKKFSTEAITSQNAGVVEISLCLEALLYKVCKNCSTVLSSKVE